MPFYRFFSAKSTKQTLLKSKSIIPEIVPQKMQYLQDLAFGMCANGKNTVRFFSFLFLRICV